VCVEGEFIEIEKYHRVELPELGGIAREGAREVTWSEVLFLSIFPRALLNLYANKVCNIWQILMVFFFKKLLS
jgi:hypothetical protein